MNVKQKMLRIYVNEDSKYKRKSLYHSIIMKLRDLNIKGVTVFRGIAGYGKVKSFTALKYLILVIAFQ